MKYLSSVLEFKWYYIVRKTITIKYSNILVWKKSHLFYLFFTLFL